MELNSHKTNFQDGESLDRTSNLVRKAKEGRLRFFQSLYALRETAVSYFLFLIFLFILTLTWRHNNNNNIIITIMIMIIIIII